MNRSVGGFKAIAYPVSSFSSTGTGSPCQCSLVFKYDNASRRATVLLAAAIATTTPKSALEEYTFVPQYDADNLLPNESCLTSGNDYISQLHMNELARHRNDESPEMKTLALNLRQSCPLWCPEFQSPAHKPIFEPSSLLQFARLSAATQYASSLITRIYMQTLRICSSFSVGQILT